MAALCRVFILQVAKAKQQTNLRFMVFSARKQFGFAGFSPTFAPELLARTRAHFSHTKPGGTKKRRRFSSVVHSYSVNFVSGSCI
jgi:hypothetical protein